MDLEKVKLYEVTMNTYLGYCRNPLFSLEKLNGKITYEITATDNPEVQIITYWVERETHE